MHRSWLLLICLAAAGCWSPAEQEVVVYSALDREFSEPVLQRFEDQSGVTVRTVFDVESTKTVGLYNRLLGERVNPQCDVFWNNEILHTLQLQQEGVLQAYSSPAGQAFPADYRDAQGAWHGLAARVRVLLVHRERVGADRPTSVQDLADPQWKGRCGIAKPLFGTTKTHAAVLFARWGNERAADFFQDVAENAVVLSGNKQVAQAVASGQLAFGLTDTDDAFIEVNNGAPVEVVFPDQSEQQEGALRIPNTLCILRNCPHPEQARRLVDYLLGPEVEAALARGESTQFPLNPAVSQSPRLELPKSVRWMDVDFQAAANAWKKAGPILRDLFHE